MDVSRYNRNSILLALYNLASKTHPWYTISLGKYWHNLWGALGRWHGGRFGLWRAILPSIGQKRFSTTIGTNGGRTEEGGSARWENFRRELMYQNFWQSWGFDGQGCRWNGKGGRWYCAVIAFSLFVASRGIYGEKNKKKRIKNKRCGLSRKIQYFFVRTLKGIRAKLPINAPEEDILSAYGSNFKTG